MPQKAASQLPVHTDTFIHIFQSLQIELDCTCNQQTTVAGLQERADRSVLALFSDSLVIVDDRS